MLALGTGAVAMAEPFPSSIIRVTVPATAGTPPDIISRLIADELAATEGWKLVVENRPGGLQTIAMADVAQRPSVGYSLLVMSVPMMVTPALLPNAGVRPDVDFVPIIRVAVSYNTLVTTPSLPVTSLPELIALLKSKPGQLNFSSAGFGTPSHLIGEMFLLQTGTRATHVPYQQLPQAIGDLIGGTNQYMFVTTLPVVDLVATGKLRALAVTAGRRIPALSDVASVAELGFTDLVAEDWIGFGVRRDTPPDMIARLNQAINKVLQEPKIRLALGKLGAEPVGGSAAEFGDVIRNQVSHWGTVIRDANIKLPQ